MKITLNNVRGFAGTHVFSIRPITILIGENSSGKTTLLAAISAILNRDFPTGDNLFNRSPFELGSFDTIATYRGGKFGRAEFFTLGFSNAEGNLPGSIQATFRNQGGVPKLDSFVVNNRSSELKGQAIKDGYEFDFRFGPARKARGAIRPPNDLQHIKFKAELLGGKVFRLPEVFRYFVSSVDRKAMATPAFDANVNRIFEQLHELTAAGSAGRPHATALAPLRTRPRRTYDELNEEFKPEGDHVPLVLARLLNKTHGESTNELAVLEKFGRDSGLFEKIDVKRMGKQPSDPFQVRIKMKGPDSNLIDVGYGVSQSLPIVIESIVAPSREILLVQQPEVHLHPKAQAALGTFFAELVSSTSKRFIVETHSDYLVDRIRIEVANGKIMADKVMLLYLERNGLDVRVHELQLDDLGNITNAPSTYRNFFLQEELNLMSRGA